MVYILFGWAKVKDSWDMYKERLNEESRLPPMFPVITEEVEVRIGRIYPEIPNEQRTMLVAKLCQNDKVLWTFLGKNRIDTMTCIFKDKGWKDILNKTWPCSDNYIGTFDTIEEALKFESLPEEKIEKKFGLSDLN